MSERVYRETGKLVEKYDVIATNRPGGGGEYPTQDGFGWTNGVMLKLMALYPADADLLEPRPLPRAERLNVGRLPPPPSCGRPPAPSLPGKLNPAKRFARYKGDHAEHGGGGAAAAPAPLPALRRRPRHAPTARRGGSR